MATPNMKIDEEGINPQKDREKLEKQLAKIKTDIGDLAATLADIGTRGAHDADERIRGLASTAEEAIEELRRQVRMIERDLEERVQEKPLQSLGIAAGIGFLAAIILRR